MKIAILHLSDFHVKSSDHFEELKIEKFADATNVFGDVDGVVIAFTGDLAASGEVNEYKAARALFYKLFNILKEKKGLKYIHAALVPGNHDLNFPTKVRKSAKILHEYDKNKIDQLLPTELSYLDNYYGTAPACNMPSQTKIIDQLSISFGNYLIQFNLINTTPFSTLAEDNKELHYFPEHYLPYLEKRENCNLAITLMHHGPEWFNWRYKHALDAALDKNSEFVLSGHEHHGETKSVSINSSTGTWMSCAGSMCFSNLLHEDSFNAILIDTDNNLFDGYIFKWSFKNKLYLSNQICSNQPIQIKSNKLVPSAAFLKSIREDSYCSTKDFTKYFVFPKLTSEEKNEFGKYKIIENSDSFFTYLTDNPRIILSGTSNSGKTTLMKYLYIELIESGMFPLFIEIDSSTKLKKDKFIKQYFSEQYGEDPVLFERFCQENKINRVLIVDGWELLPEGKGRESILSEMEKFFGNIIIGTSDSAKSVFDSIREEIINSNAYSELKIRPFFAEKRNSLVRKVCEANNFVDVGKIDKIANIIDNLVQNSDIFSLNPGFIVTYTGYFVKECDHDYIKGEATFGKIFEHKLEDAIIAHTSKDNVAETFMAIQLVAGYMYSSKKDVIKIDEFSSIVEQYKLDYGVKINASDLLDICQKTKLFKVTSDLQLYFSNKSYLAYFIAKYLFRQMSEEDDFDGVKEALLNICFGINADIVMFLSYLLNNSKIIFMVAEETRTLLSTWPEIDLENKNIAFISKRKSAPISAPTEQEQKNMKEEREKHEEAKYDEVSVQATGLFDYDPTTRDTPANALLRALRYTEILCKALPLFNSSLKIDQKRDLANMIYSFPQRIVYGLLKPLDDNFTSMCESLLNACETQGIKTPSGRDYTQEDLEDIFAKHGINTLLSTTNHFSELCTSSKSIDLLTENLPTKDAQRLEYLLIISSLGDTHRLISEAEKLINESKNIDFIFMTRLIMRRYVLVNPNLSFHTKQSINDKFLKDKGKWVLKSL